MAFSQAVRLALHLGSTAVLARLLSVDDFGVYAIGTAFTMVLSRFSDGGLRLANVQASVLTYGQATTLAIINAGIGIVLSSIVMLLGPSLAYVYGEPQVTAVMFVLGLSYFVSTLGIQSNGILHRRLQLATMAIIDVVALIVSVAVSIASGLAGLGVLSLALGHLALSFVKSCSSILMARWLPSRPVPLREVKPLIRFGIGLALSGAVNQVGLQTDRALLGAIDTHATGLYNKALSLATLPLEQLAPAAAGVAIPTLSSLNDQPGAYRRAYDRLLSGLTLLTVPFTCIVMLEADVIVRLILGEKWLAAVPIYRWLCVGSILLPVWNSTGWLYVSQGRSSEMFKWHILDSCAKIVAAAVGVWWGATGLAIGFSLRYVFLIPVLFRWVGIQGPVGRESMYSHAAAAVVLSAPGLIVAWGMLALLDAMTYDHLYGVGASVYLLVFSSTILVQSKLREQALYFGIVFRGLLLGGKTSA